MRATVDGTTNAISGLAAASFVAMAASQKVALTGPDSMSKVGHIDRFMPLWSANEATGPRFYFHPKFPFFFCQLQADSLTPPGTGSISRAALDGPMTLQVSGDVNNSPTG